MAISYGTASTGGGAQNFRVGYEFLGWSAVDSSSATVTGTIRFYVRNAAAVTSDLQTFNHVYTNVSTAAPAQVQITNTQTVATDRTIGPERTVTYTYSTWGSSPGNFTGSITGLGSASGTDGFYTGGPAYHDWTIAIPARPGGPPTVDTATATAGIRSASISWTASGDPGITSYQVFRSDLVEIGVSGTTASDTSLGNSAIASYTVYANSPAGQGQRTTNSITTKALPGTPGSLTANTSTFGTIGLSWTASSGDGYTVTYTIARSGTTLGTTTSTSYNDTTVAPYTAYTYTVTPSTDVGSGTAASVSATSMGGVAKVWNGTSWVTILPKVWNGTSWVEAQARMWNGTSWVHGI